MAGGENMDVNNNLSNKEIGTRIKNCRVSLGLTLQQIANTVGVAPSTIQRYESGTISQYKLPILESIANTLGVNPVWLVKRDAPMFAETKNPSILEEQLLSNFKKLNQIGQEEALKRIKELTCLPMYTDKDMD